MGVRFLKIAAVYFSIGVLLGLTMGIIHNFVFASVHAHINLLGWVSMALFGIIYHLYPKAAETGLAKTHFWLHNLGLPVMQGSLFFMLLTESDHPAFIVVTIIGSVALVAGVLLFMVNLFQQVKSSQNASSSSNFSA